ncbi:LCP family protein [Terracoccus sp. 273MFTsu3.1]|uniref:LCP family protein n=1 Tax=Terracoccus sp. 273MFTsu3.1 TaxID=1172188 RepID=UPI0003A5E8F3|nr:LCP family protein [Terracoccus sp. 273MFTsu3.1]
MTSQPRPTDVRQPSALPADTRRPARSRLLVVARAGAVSVAAAVALAGCSTGAPGGTGSAVGASATADGATSGSKPSSSGVRVSGAPAPLAALVSRLYAGGDLTHTSSHSAAAALKTRKAAPGPVTARAEVGSWLGTPVAVVTAGDDVTLAVGPTWKVVGGWWPSLGVAKPSLGGGPRWVLAIGSDARKGQPLERTRADVLQVIGIDGQGGGGVMGMARDLWVPLATGGKGKINSAMVFGGPRAQVSTVRSVTGLPVEGYVVLGFSGFKKIVDDEGGIPIVIPKTVVASHAKNLVIKAGAQTLSGAEALAYARERKTLPDGDFGRSRHQGEVILAAAVKAKLAGPIAIPSALTSFSAVGRSNLSAEQILTFAAGLHQLSPLRVGRGVAQGAFGWAGQQSIVVLGRQARTLFAEFRDGNLS